MPRDYILSPSILSADFTQLGQDLRDLIEAGSDWIHIDVMDGHFVPNITMGPFIVEAVRRITSLTIDVHLMIETPERFIEDFAQAGANILTVHIEGNPNIHRTLQSIHALGCQAGIVLNPGTPVSAIAEVIPMVDLVLVMSVNPGFSGQEFLPSSLNKIRQVRQLLDLSNPDAWLEVDGGVAASNLPALIEAGANAFVAATSVFRNPDGITGGVRRLKNSFPP